MLKDKFDKYWIAAGVPMIQLRWGDETVWKDTHFETVDQARASWALKTALAEST